MTTLWVDAGNGAAGDMLLAALLDAGADLAVVRAALARLAVEPVELTVEQVTRQGLRACRVHVHAPQTTTHRGLAQVTGLIRRAELPPPVASLALEVFDRLAHAEARVHGVDTDQVHFHEVGALDAIADVVGCAAALHDLGVLGDDAVRVVSPVAVGSGTVTTAHGRLPVPVPAVLELLTAAHAPIASHPEPRELCTPTGAALLCTIATGWGTPPDGRLTTIGVGAGRADPAGHPNVLRAVFGQSVADEGTGATTQTLWQLETTVDDMDPRVWPDLLQQLRQAGAADAWCTPVLMRKGRPGQVLTVLMAAHLVDDVCAMVFTHTPTLGVRLAPVQRRALARDWVQVPVAGGQVRVKRGLLAGRVVTVQPEYDDARALAQRSGRPVEEIIYAARAAAHHLEFGD